VEGARDGDNWTGYDVKRTRYSGKGTGDAGKGAGYDEKDAIDVVKGARDS